MTKLKVLTFVRYYLPGYKSGGPVRTIANMVDHLSDEIDFYIVTSDRDAFDSKPYVNVKVNTWNSVGKAKVFYANKKNRSFWRFAYLIKETPHNVIYLNSLFDPVFTLQPLIARALGIIPKTPFILAPRGEFSVKAQSIKSWKKRPYLWFSRMVGLYNGLTWQASSEYEALDIRRAIGYFANHIIIAPDLPPLIVPEYSDIKRASTNAILFIVFLSRITPMKNLYFALQVLAQVKVPIMFYIYGPIWDNSYWYKCQELINTLPDHIEVYYKGPVTPEKVPEIMAANDLFFFPTKGENFGHVILEALSVGTPVLISDKTPWEDDLIGGCMVRPLENMSGFVEMIEKIASYTLKERKKIKNAAKSLANSFFNKTDIYDRNLQLFKEHSLSRTDT